MKVVIKKEIVLSALQVITKIPTKHPTLQILSYIKCEATVDSFEIYATNLGVAISMSLPVLESTPGVCAVDGSLLQQTIQSAGDTVTITLESNLCKITTDTSEIHLKTAPFEDMPSMPTIEGGEWIRISGEECADGIKSVAFASATSEIRPELASVYVSVRNSQFICAATDSFKLAEYRNPISSSEEGVILIPIRYAADIIRAIEKVKTPISITKSNTITQFSSKNAVITVRTLDGNYPNYEQIIPQNPTTSAEMLKDDLKTLIKTILPFADSGLSRVDLQLDAENGMLMGETGTQGEGYAKSSQRSVITGQSLTLRLNGKILGDIIGYISDDRVIIGCTEANRPVLLTGAKDKKNKYLIMPMTR